MSRKHFIELAKSIRLHNQFDSKSAPFTIAQVEIIMDFCASQNPNFDRDRFLAACGLERN